MLENGEKRLTAQLKKQREESMGGMAQGVEAKRMYLLFGPPIEADFRVPEDKSREPRPCPRTSIFF